MALGQPITGGLLAVVLAVGSAGLGPVGAGAEPAQILAQLQAGSVTGRLDESSQVLGDGSYYNIHTFEGQAGDPIRIDSASEAFDTYLILVGPDGSAVDRDDDSGSGTNSGVAKSWDEFRQEQVHHQT